MEEVVGEVFLDHVTLEAAADDEVIDAVMRVNLHNVPEYRKATDLDHRLRLEVCLLGNACAQTTGQDNCFHKFTIRVLSNDIVKQWAR